MGHGLSKAAKQQTKQSDAQLETKSKGISRTSGAAAASSNATGRNTVATIIIRSSSKQHFVPGNQALNRYMTTFFSTPELRKFSQLSRTCRTDAKLELDKRATLRLLEHTIKGEEDQAKKMLETNPRLLLINSAKTVDYSGKLITGLTPFQAAICAGDVDMIKMMQPYFAALEYVVQKLAEQINAIFPEGYDAHLSAQDEATFNFSTVFNAIAHASDNDIQIALSLSGASFEQGDEARSKDDSDLTLIEALNRFRETFSQQSPNETIYNPLHLLKAFALYDATYDPANRGQWNRGKRDLFWRQIIGFCQRFVPACTAQAFAQGLCYLVKVPEYQLYLRHAEHFKRSLKFKYGEGSIYPIASFSGLGFDYAVSFVTGVVRGAGPASWPIGGGKIYFNLINKSLRNYIRKHHSDTGCTPLTTLAR